MKRRIIFNKQSDHLPVQLTSLVGREQEAASLYKLLCQPEVRLVTIMGPGGVGKTSLALQVTHDVQNALVDGVFFISLGAITDSTLIIPSIARTLGVIESPNRLLFDSLKDYLRDKLTLLLLDNFEQILSAAPLLTELLSECDDREVRQRAREVGQLAELPVVEPGVERQPEPAQAGEAGAEGAVARQSRRRVGVRAPDVGAGVPGRDVADAAEAVARRQVRLEPRQHCCAAREIGEADDARGDALATRGLRVSRRDIPLCYTKRLSVWRLPALLAGNRFNLEHAIRWNPEAVCIPSAVDMDRYPSPGGKAETAECGRVRTIGWIGSGSTVPYLGLLVPPLRELAQEGRSIELLVAGTIDAPVPLPSFEGVKVTEVSTYSGDAIPSLVPRMDIGVTPLTDGPWERGKGALKAVVYMAGSIPTVCSRVGEAVHLIRDGENGYLASTTQEWKEKLSALLDDPELRRRIGGSGRRSVEEEYSAGRCFERMWREVFSLIPGKSRRRDTVGSANGGG